MKDYRFPQAWPFDFGAYIRNLRESRDLRVADVAELSGGNIAGASVSVIERNLLQGGPSLRQLEGFSQAFKIPTIYLFALAYIADQKLDPATVDKVWHEFTVDHIDAQDEKSAVVSVPRQHLELLSLTQDNLRFYSLRKAGLLSVEATRLGYVTDCDIVAVDPDGDVHAGSSMVGWWQEQEKLVVYRHNIDVASVLIPAQTAGEPYLILNNVKKLKRLGVVVWRCGPVPER
jgi:transcriptional regulator with XRE-family HTH domain